MVVGVMTTKQKREWVEKVTTKQFRGRGKDQYETKDWFALNVFNTHKHAVTVAHLRENTAISRTYDKLSTKARPHV